MKTVIGGCKTALKSAKNLPEQEINENALVIQALKLNTLSKLTFSDAKQFNRLIEDMFQSEVTTAHRNTGLEIAIEESFKFLGLQYNLRQVRKYLIINTIKYVKKY